MTGMDRKTPTAERVRSIAHRRAEAAPRLERHRVQPGVGLVLGQELGERPPGAQDGGHREPLVAPEALAADPGEHEGGRDRHDPRHGEPHTGAEAVLHRCSGEAVGALASDRRGAHGFELPRRPVRWVRSTEIAARPTAAPTCRRRTGEGIAASRPCSSGRSVSVLLHPRRDHGSGRHELGERAQDLGPLGGVADHDDRSLDDARLLLHTARVGHEQAALGRQGEELPVAEWAR